MKQLLLTIINLKNVFKRQTNDKFWSEWLENNLWNINQQVKRRQLQSFHFLLWIQYYVHHK